MATAFIDYGLNPTAILWTEEGDGMVSFLQIPNQRGLWDEFPSLTSAFSRVTEDFWENKEISASNQWMICASLTEYPF